MKNGLWSLKFFSSLTISQLFPLKSIIHSGKIRAAGVRKSRGIFCYENIGNWPFEIASDSVITTVPKNLIYFSRMKKISLICKKHKKDLVSLNFGSKFSFPQNLSSRLTKMTSSSSLKRSQTKHHWELYSNQCWLAVGQKNELQQYSFKSILNMLNLSWTYNFAMRNFRYIQGLLKNTLARVEVKDLQLNFFNNFF